MGVTYIMQDEREERLSFDLDFNGFVFFGLLLIPFLG